METVSGARMTEGNDTPAPLRDRRSGVRAEAGSLYVVATPVGNLRDVTLRALDILRSADIIAAEDTRVTMNLLARYAIVTRPRALHRHNEAREIPPCSASSTRDAASRSSATRERRHQRSRCAPGPRRACAGHRVVPIPGATAVATAISAAGLVAERFAFIGFLPAQARRGASCWQRSRHGRSRSYSSRRRTASATRSRRSRARSTDDGRSPSLASSRRRSRRSRPCRSREACAWLEADANRARGEFVLIVDAPVHDADANMPSADVDRLLTALLGELPPARAARVAPHRACA